jgi:uncharacterized repeat protein (TIGR03803 family)
MEVKTVNKSKGYRTLVFVLALTVLFAGQTVYAQTYSVLYDFGATSGSLEFPLSPLVQGPDGTLYGTALVGSVSDQGGIFRLNAASKVGLVYGGEPYIRTLTLRPDGHFLGFSLVGDIFDVTTTGSATVLYSFTGGLDGWSTSLVVGPDGSFYGVTYPDSYTDGAADCGSAYRLTPAPTGVSVVFTLLHTFTMAQGCPSDLLLGTDGNFYGIVTGADTGYGNVFRMTRNGAVTVLPLSGLPNDQAALSLALGNDGNFYGIAQNASQVAIFKMTTGGAYTVLNTLSLGEQVVGNGLFQASDGNFYGGANGGGTGGVGILYRITPSGNFTVVYNFDYTTGAYPNEPFQATNGIMYGTTYQGGEGNGNGVLYSLSDNLPPYAALIPPQERVGIPIEILGQGFTSSTTVSFNGMPAAAVKVSSPTRLLATVPDGAKTGYVTVTTESGTLTSMQPFVVAP